MTKNSENSGEDQSALLNTKNEARISARVSIQVKEVIDIAAELSGATTTQFMAQAAYQAAQNLIEQERILRLSSRDTMRLMNLLDNPPSPNKKLIAAAEHYKQSSLNVKN